MNETEKNFDWVTVQERENSEIELTGELPAEDFEQYRARAIVHLKEHAELPGFRKGHVPDDMFVKAVGEGAILEEAAEIALADLYPQIVLAKKLDVVGRPQIAITKLAKGNPLGFKATTAVMPNVVLPDYTALAKEVLADFADENTEVTDDEFEEFLKSLRTQYAQAEGSGQEVDPNAPITEVPTLPELNDEFVQKLGNFENVEDFRTKARAHMQEEKVRKLKEKKRLSITDKIISESEMALPAIFVDSELEKMTAQFGSDIERMGMKLEDYLAGTKKSLDDLKNEWRAEAAKRAKLQLILNAIAEKEDIRANAEDIKREMDHITEHFKDADRERLHIYVESMLRNEATLAFLERA